MTGTVTTTELASGSVKQITFAWTADGSGNATATTKNSYAGAATLAVFTPGTPTPTTLYDVTLSDVGAVDILGGAGANLTVTGAVAKQAADGLTSIVTAGVLALSITHAGASAQGTIIVEIVGTTNAYCTLQQVKNRLSSDSLKTNSTDDTVIYEMIDEASRAIDLFCGSRTFYARTAETRYFDSVGGRQLDMDDDLLAITTLANGDASTIAASDYDLIDKNIAPYYAIRLKMNSGLVWLLDDDGSPEYAISVLGTWGYVDRAATDWRSTQVIRNTEHAAIETVCQVYKSRYGNTSGSATIVTPSGMVITPQDIPGWARGYIDAYRRRY